MCAQLLNCNGCDVGGTALNCIMRSAQSFGSDHFLSFQVKVVPSSITRVFLAKVQGRLVVHMRRVRLAFIVSGYCADHVARLLSINALYFVIVHDFFSLCTSSPPQAVRVLARPLQQNFQSFRYFFKHRYMAEVEEMSI